MVKPGFWDPQKCPFPLNRGNRYKEYGNIFPGQNFVSREWRCSLNRRALMERFHCSQDKQNRKSERKRKNPSGSGREGLLSPVHISVPRLFLLPRAIPCACFSYPFFGLGPTTDFTSPPPRDVKLLWEGGIYCLQKVK